MGGCSTTHTCRSPSHSPYGVARRRRRARRRTAGSSSFENPISSRSGQDRNGAAIHHGTSGSTHWAGVTAPGALPQHRIGRRCPNPGRAWWDPPQPPQPGDVVDAQPIGMREHGMQHVTICGISGGSQLIRAPRRQTPICPCSLNVSGGAPMVTPVASPSCRANRRHRQDRLRRQGRALPRWTSHGRRFSLQPQHSYAP